MLPTLTIVTPSFNQSRFLDETLRSVRAQREDVHEYFVLDGGSSDESTEVIRRHADIIDYWTSGPDGGQASAIHEGFRRATGDVLYWLNSDDLLLPGALRHVREAFCRPDAPSVITGWDLLIDAESRIKAIRRPPPQTLWAARWGVTHVTQPTCFFRREIYEDLGGLRRELECVLDTELWYRMLSRVPRWGQIRRPLAAFRVHAASKGNSWGVKYACEHRWLALAHSFVPTSGLRFSLGVSAYRLKEALRGRYLRDAVASRRLSGRFVGSLTIADIDALGRAG